ncbi:MAG: HAD-IIB family hydrolase [Mycoplasmataceae bacterium]|nr:HAD-IIB family hydrolase [Mycoplasmataceae bacterium]
MKNIFAFDLDGTLLGKDNKVKESVKEALKMIDEKGDYSVINTGRHYLTTKSVSNDSGIKYSINLNGSAIYDFNKGSYLDITKFENEEDIFDVLKYCEINNHSLYIYSANHIIFWALGHRSGSINAFFNVHLNNNQYIYINSKTAEEVMEFMKKNNYSFTKFIINSDDVTEYGEHEFFNDCFDALSDVGKVYIGSEGQSQIEVSIKDSSKLKGLYNFIDLMNINDDIRKISFGDSYNDIEMFEGTDYSYVMNTAPKDVIDKASNITDSNENDGILKGVKHFYDNYNI